MRSSGKQVKTYLNVLTNEKTTQRPASGTSGDVAAPPVPAPLLPKAAHPQVRRRRPLRSKAADPGASVIGCSS